MAIDATNKWPQETKRIWGDIIEHAKADGKNPENFRITKHLKLFQKGYYEH